MIPEIGNVIVETNQIPVVGIGVQPISQISLGAISEPYIRNPDGIMQIANEREWMMEPPRAVPGDVPLTDHLGRPIVELPGCVVVHKENARGNENMQLVDDDPSGNMAYCDAGQPAFRPINYDPDKLKLEDITPEQDYTPPPPKVPPRPESPPPSANTPEPPRTPTDKKEDPPCPGPMAPRIGDVAQNQKEKVSGFELQRDPVNPDGAKICVTLYEDIGVVEAFLPSPQVVTTTAVIATVATGSALLAKPLADLLLKVVKPVVKKAIGTIQKKLGKTPYSPTQAELQTNKYREKKGLLPINFAKQHSQREKTEKERKKKEKESQKKKE